MCLTADLCPCLSLPESFKSTLAAMMDVTLLKDPVFMLISVSNFFGMMGLYVPFVYLVDSAMLVVSNCSKPLSLYGRETWSLTLREECRLSVFENRVLRRVFGPKRDEVTGEWRKLHNEELRDLCSLPNIVQVVKSRRMRWVGHVVHMGEGRGVHRVLVGKPEGKRPLGRPRRRWEDNIKMDLQEVGGDLETGWSWLRIGTGRGHL